jgi:nucleoside-diphosphate-sugar epimerase
VTQGQLYLVTGGAGFIGSNIAEALVKRGNRVRVLDNFVSGLRENLEAVGTCELVEGDLRNPDDVRRAVEGVEGVFTRPRCAPCRGRSTTRPARTR